MINDKKVTFKGKDYTIVEFDINEDDIESSTFTIENEDEKKAISIKAFQIGTATTKDEYINSLVKKLASESETQSQPKQQLPQKSEKERGIEDAQEDFFAKPKNSTYFKKLDKEKYNGFSEYEEAYYNEFNRLNSSAISKKKRLSSENVGNTYNGDVDELIDWLKKAIVSIDVEASDYTYNATKDMVDEFNKRDRTNYEVRLRGKVGSAYIARLTNDKNILKDMPEEVRDWKARKNTGVINQFELGNVYSENDNTLTSNSIVFDLLDTYKFKLGKQKTSEEQ